jgi:SPP1 family predicted phage head-tail adaptor
VSIKAGDLKHPIKLQRPVTTRNEKSKTITTWEDVVTVYAGKTDVSGREFYIAQAYHAEDVVTFTVRWRDDIAPTWRVVHHGTAYNILEINHLGYMRDFMRLKCKAVQGEGA